MSLFHSNSSIPAENWDRVFGKKKDKNDGKEAMQTKEKTKTVNEKDN
jgi:hypothetical protein